MSEVTRWEHKGETFQVGDKVLVPSSRKHFTIEVLLPILAEGAVRLEYDERLDTAFEGGLGRYWNVDALTKVH